jgi:hypothetical protein
MVSLRKLVYIIIGCRNDEMLQRTVSNYSKVEPIFSKLRIKAKK